MADPDSKGTRGARCPIESRNPLEPSLAPIGATRTRGSGGTRVIPSAGPASVPWSTCPSTCARLHFSPGYRGINWLSVRSRLPLSPLYAAECGAGRFGEYWLSLPETSCAPPPCRGPMEPVRRGCAMSALVKQSRLRLGQRRAGITVSSSAFTAHAWDHVESPRSFRAPERLLTRHSASSLNPDYLE